jgi:hypothetical protein
MRKTAITAACAAGIFIAAAVTIAALQTAQPGQMTQARIWVENRGRNEAVPVDLRDVNLDKPLRVYVLNGESGPGDATAPLQVRTARQNWEYDTVAVAAGKDVAAALNARGAAGWEAVGTVSVTDERAATTILLKRPR